MLCKRCNTDKDEDDFSHELSHGKVYVRHVCKSCRRKRGRNRRAEKRKWVREYKRKCGCERCGITDIRVLEFHHLHDKSKEVSNMMSMSLDHIKEEVDKCIVLCANCHRITHAEEREGQL